MHLDPVSLQPFQPSHPSPRGSLPLHWAWDGLDDVPSKRLATVGREGRKDTGSSPPSSETYYRRTIEENLVVSRWPGLRLADSQSATGREQSKMLSAHLALAALSSRPAIHPASPPQIHQIDHAMLTCCCRRLSRWPVCLTAASHLPCPLPRQYRPSDSLLVGLGNRLRLQLRTGTGSRRGLASLNFFFFR